MKRDGRRHRVGHHRWCNRERCRRPFVSRAHRSARCDRSRDQEPDRCHHHDRDEAPSSLSRWRTDGRCRSTGGCDWSSLPVGTALCVALVDELLPIDDKLVAVILSNIVSGAGRARMQFDDVRVDALP